MGAAGRPSYRTDLQSEDQTVQPAAGRRGLANPLRPPPRTALGRDLLPAAAVACATCGTEERGSEVLEASPFSGTPLT